MEFDELSQIHYKPSNFAEVLNKKKTTQEKLVNLNLIGTSHKAFIKFEKY